MILHIEFTHDDDNPIVRGTVEIPDLPEHETDAIKRLIYLKQDIVLTGAHRLRMKVTHNNWSKVYMPSSTPSKTNTQT